jgi:hypothetical protein
MLDLSYFQNNGNVNTQTFTNAGSWVTWVKPRGAKLVNIMCIGSGAGGGGAVTGSSRGLGGSGGGGGAITKSQFQASILPDVLYVYTGVGGSGSLGSSTLTYNSSSVGEKSYVCIIPDTSSISNIVVTSGTLSARGAFSNLGGNGETAATVASAVFLNLGTFTSTPGTAGAGGSTVTAGGSITPSSITTGGAGGTGNSTGGGFAAAGPYPAISGIATSAVNPGTNGPDGLIFYKPIMAFMGGTAGGSGVPTGGNGGNGSYGSGGAGGGGGTVTGGNGGRGGDGLIIITTSF